MNVETVEPWAALRTRICFPAFQSRPFGYLGSLLAVLSQWRTLECNIARRHRDRRAYVRHTTSAPAALRRRFSCRRHVRRRRRRRVLVYLEQVHHRERRYRRGRCPGYPAAVR